MSFPVIFTPGVTRRLPIETARLDSSPPAGGYVLLISSAEFEAAGGPPAGAVTVVLGEVGTAAAEEAFLVLPAECSDEVLTSAVHAANELLASRARNERLRFQSVQAHAQRLELLRVGSALSAERDLDALLRLILTTARKISGADAGSVYLVVEQDGRRELSFELVQNDSVAIPFERSSVPLDAASLAGFVAVSGETVTVADARRLPPGAPYRFNPSFDQTAGYLTRSLLAAPMITRAGEVIGVVQLINHLRVRGAKVLDVHTADAVVGPFPPAEVEVVQALAAQAAVAIENSRLVAEIERLFEAFVQASVTAIEQRDPTTSGHSLRVADMCMALAEAAEASEQPPFAGIHFTRDELTELRYAALLHDFGKVGVREAVLTKAKKLLPDRVALVEERFRHARRAREVGVMEAALESLLTEARVPSRDDLYRCADERELIGREIVADLELVRSANEPSPLAVENGSRLAAIAGKSFPGPDGRPEPYLRGDELRSLAVPRGSLDEDERRQIESHVANTYEFLLTIPWPRRLSRIPSIAFAHHEAPNGSGYPRHLSADAIPLEARLMAVCDVYDALSASDRPYKPALAPEEASSILRMEAERGLLDGAVVELFIGALLGEPVGVL